MRIGRATIFFKTGGCPSCFDWPEAVVRRAIPFSMARQPLATELKESDTMTIKDVYAYLCVDDAARAGPYPSACGVALACAWRSASSAARMAASLGWPPHS